MDGYVGTVLIFLSLMFGLVSILLAATVYFLINQAIRVHPDANAASRAVRSISESLAPLRGPSRPAKSRPGRVVVNDDEAAARAEAKEQEQHQVS
jgi:hypothetical protein